MPRNAAAAMLSDAGRRARAGGAIVAAGALLVAVAQAGALVGVAGPPGHWAGTGFFTAALSWAGGALITCIGCLLRLRGAPPAAAGPVPVRVPRARRLLLHASPLAAYAGVPMGHLLAPLAVWRLSPDAGTQWHEEARTLVEFQLTVTVFAVAAVMLCAVIVGFFLLAALVVCHLAMIVVAVIQAARGRPVRPPLVVGFLR